ncbi:MAG TPA: hypothetical protein VH559_05660 [Gemmatimonadaceae bacterium]
MDEILDVTLLVAAAFERIGIVYLIGGSLASSLHGVPRSTLDVHFVAQLEQRKITALIDELHGTFYLDEDAIRDAIARRTSFNLIHLESYLKADVFVAKDDEAFRLQMQLRQRFVLGETSNEIVVASPEDVVAQKLSWFALGGEVSERQWLDALGVLKVSAPILDLAYLHRIAVLLGVEPLLERALREARLEA